jgi:hypothetical protein
MDGITMHNNGDMLAQRWEVKYVVDRSTRTALDRDLRALMQADRYTGDDGSYLVRSLYFDTPDYMAYHSKMAGEPVRHKLRARTYTHDPALVRSVRLEVKSRYLNTVHKLAADVGRRLPPARLVESQAELREFFRLYKMYNMEPKILVQYRRRAFERRDLVRVRVNFDFDIVASRDPDLFGDLRHARRLLRYDHSVFEIKVDGAMPYWLHMLIGKYDLQVQPFSKFCHAIRSQARISALARGD